MNGQHGHPAVKLVVVEPKNVPEPSHRVHLEENHVHVKHLREITVMKNLVLVSIFQLRTKCIIETVINIERFVLFQRMAAGQNGVRGAHVR